MTSLTVEDRTAQSAVEAVAVQARPGFGGTRRAPGGGRGSCEAPHVG
jgi:hypothetical protein